MKNETKFRNCYRIPSNRMSGWDYSEEGVYFLTVCTHHRECLFGEIVGRDMILNDLGMIVQREWIYSGQMRAEIILGPYVIMPDHFHAIVYLVPNRLENDSCDGTFSVPVSDVPLLRRKSQSVSSLMAGFKSAVTRQVNMIRGTPGEKVWQTNYYDHIIRNERAYQQIAAYIEMNPERWQSG